MCDYCEKVNNKPLVETVGEFSKNSGVKADILYWKKKKKASLSVFGWYDTYVGIESVELEINYCPMCGRSLTNGKS